VTKKCVLCGCSNGELVLIDFTKMHNLHTLKLEASMVNYISLLSEAGKFAVATDKGLFMVEIAGKETRI